MKKVREVPTAIIREWLKAFTFYSSIDRRLCLRWVFVYLLLGAGNPSRAQRFLRRWRWECIPVHGLEICLLEEAVVKQTALFTHILAQQMAFFKRSILWCWVSDQDLWAPSWILLLVTQAGAWSRRKNRLWSHQMDKAHTPRPQPCHVARDCSPSHWPGPVSIFTCKHSSQECPTDQKQVISVLWGVFH